MLSKVVRVRIVAISVPFFASTEVWCVTVWMNKFELVSISLFEIVGYMVKGFASNIMFEDFVSSNSD